MILQKDQDSLFDSGDTEAVVEQGVSESKCGFCAVLRGDQKVTLIRQNDRIMSFLDHRPLFYGHVLLIPKIHVLLLSELPEERVQEFFVEAQRLERAVEAGLEVDGSMILINKRCEPVRSALAFACDHPPTEERWAVLVGAAPSL